jgi:hypothetical protein
MRTKREPLRLAAGEAKTGVDEVLMSAYRIYPHVSLVKLFT